jgi:hypothetical protein
VLVKIEILGIALLFCVAINAFVTAINARGPIRVVLSYFLAFLCFGTALFFTTQYDVNSVTVSKLPEKNLETNPTKLETILPAQSASTAPEGVVIAPPAPDTQAIAASHNDAAVGEAKQKLKTVLEVAQRLERTLSAATMDGVENLSDEEYEQIQTKAAASLAETRKVRDRAIAASKGPEGVKEIESNLVKASESLVLAATQYERFFKSENKVEEEEHQSAFHKASQSAAVYLKRAADLLNP